ncbi:MAG: Ser-Thr-rich GPI-anchored membrane family protein [Planctomycetota bacterium]|nr:Ser-Thr-rich GPI-anchored membrane family protein [Planctomycetota bacterium]MDI6787887.1 Ser-Thr-rich GPI-anchored membrane family protein [Planctomycetota bacterium]
MKHTTLSTIIAVGLFIAGGTLFAQESITVVSPNGNETYAVGTTQTISWTSSSTIVTVNLLYSSDNFETVTNTITANLPNTGSYEWVIPDDISTDFRFRVKVISASAFASYDVSDAPFKIKANISVTAPGGGERWVSNEEHFIRWVITGTVPSVALYYSTDDFVSENLLITTTANTGSYYWKIPDRGGLKAKSKVMVADTRDLLSFGRSPNFFRIDYYYITFVIKDKVTREHMRAMTFMDPLFGWSEYPVSSPKTLGYPYSTHTTIICRTGYFEEAIEMWVADRDKTFTRYMDSSVVHSWQIAVDFNYNPASDTLLTTVWFMRDGLIMYDPLPQRIRIDIYDQQGSFVKTLESTTPNENGVFIINWERTGLRANITYWARTELRYSDVPFRSALTFKIDSGGGTTINNTYNNIYSNIWEIKGNFNYNYSLNRLEATVWLTQNGVIVTTPERVAIEIRDYSGSVILTYSSPVSPSVSDTWGVFRTNWDNVALDVYQTYSAYITILDRGEEYDGIIIFEIDDAGMLSGSSGEEPEHKAWYKPWTGCGYLGIEPIILIALLGFLKRKKSSHRLHR